MILVVFAISLPLYGAEGAASAFEIKGYAPGMDIAAIDTSACRSDANVDSGVPGFRCDTTLAGDKAELRLAVFEAKVIAVIFRVENALMAPTLDALSQKYGRPAKSNQFIEDYHWSKGDVTMGIAERRVTSGYQVMIVDLALFHRASAAAAEKAKKDL
jgi:hypothetical protein